MKREITMKHEFVEYLPNQLAEATIYVSMKYAMAAHKCCCGCGSEVVTPFSPTDWRMIFDGETISLDPSIGNWSFACRSHYWIRGNKVRWARSWSGEEVEAVRNRDRIAKDAYFDLDRNLVDAKTEKPRRGRRGQKKRKD